MRDIGKVGCGPIFSEININANWFIPSLVCVYFSVLEIASYNF